MKDIKCEMKNVTLLVLKIYRLFQSTGTRSFLSTQETEKVCSWAYLLQNNQVRQFVKIVSSSTSRTYAIFPGLDKNKNKIKTRAESGSLQA